MPRSEYCPNDATEQFIWVSLQDGSHKISPPVCRACSAESQPPETIMVLPLFDVELPCNGPYHSRSFQ